MKPEALVDLDQWTVDVAGAVKILETNKQGQHVPPAAPQPEAPAQSCRVLTCRPARLAPTPATTAPWRAAPPIPSSLPSRLKQHLTSAFSSCPDRSFDIVKIACGGMDATLFNHFDQSAFGSYIRQ